MICWSVGIIFFLILVFGIHSHLTIQDAAVDVMVPTNPPPIAVAAGSSRWFVDVPYSQVTNKPVSVVDIKQIKAAVPWSKTTLIFYQVSHIVIDSPTEARVEFWRGRKFVDVSLEKTDGVWNVKGGIHAHTVTEFATPPGFWEKINEALPF
jgi:hypothetical protein